MFTRIVDCTLKPEKRADFNKTLHDQVLPVVKTQPGFVELIGLTSSEHPDHALAITFWRTQEDADRFYVHAAPMVDTLRPLLAKEPAVEHYYLDSLIFPFTAAGKAA